MSEFKFIGEVLNINEKQLKFLTAAFEKRGFENGTVKVESVGKVDDNYGSSVKRFTIDKNEHTLRMIAKIAATNPQMRMSTQSEVTFKNEGLMYSKVLPKFVDLQTKAGILKDEMLIFAECFGVYLEEPHEIILLEDLKESNFCILDKFEPLNDDTVKLVLQNFAILHSLSFVLKHEDPDTYMCFTDELVNAWLCANELAGINAFFTSLEEEVLDFVDNETDKRIIRGSLTHISKNIMDNRKINEKYSIIQQGDAWTNNIMFTLENNKTVKCCMIDYQNSNEFSPAADILYMIFNCTDYKTRSTQYYNWIDFYYNKLEDFLRNFGLNTDVVYPKEVLHKDLKKMGKIAFGQAIMAASFLVRESHEATNLKDTMKDSKTDERVAKYKLSNLGESSLKRYREKLDGLLKSYKEIGFDIY